MTEEHPLDRWKRVIDALHEHARDRTDDRRLAESACIVLGVSAEDLAWFADLAERIKSREATRL